MIRITGALALAGRVLAGLGVPFWLLAVGFSAATRSLLFLERHWTAVQPARSPWECSSSSLRLNLQDA